MSSINRLIGISDGISADDVDLPVQHEGLKPLYASQNGARAFESCLLILPTTRTTALPTLQDWNAQRGWRKHYNIPNEIVFFAMDVFAGQFGIDRDGRIHKFDPETGELSSHSSDLEGWATKILSDFDFELGFSAAHQWQRQNRPLDIGSRLLPRQPFVLGGEYSASNLVSWPIHDALEQYANIFRQIREIADGQVVEVNGWLAK